MVEFEEDKSYEDVPEKGTNIRVEVPVVNVNRSVGLAGLSGLLPSQDRDLTFESSGLYGDVIKPLPAAESEERPVRIVELIIQRASEYSVTNT